MYLTAQLSDQTAQLRGFTTQFNGLTHTLKQPYPGVHIPAPGAYPRAVSALVGIVVYVRFAAAYADVGH